MERLADKVAMVSGGASGIGAAVAERLEAEGATVVRCDITATDGGVMCDITDPESCAAAVAETLEQYEQLDILANVAGIASMNRIEDVSAEMWRKVIDVNLTGTFLLTQAALPPLIQAKGAIVNMASLAGLQGTPYNAAYCASKGGVIAMTRSMAVELAPTGVRVNAVCPGAVDTPLLAGVNLPEDANFDLLMRSVSTLGGVIEPAEVAAAVAYLASSEAASISGTTLTIDGAASA